MPPRDTPKVKVEKADISIPLSTYVDLLKCKTFLYALELAGVEKWEGFERAKQIEEQLEC